MELKIWKLVKNAPGDGEGYGWAWFDEKKGIRIPLKPFLGEIGVAPAEKGQYSTIPPYVTGGNIDLKHITAGTTVFLPVKVDGALFSVGVSNLSLRSSHYFQSAYRTVMQLKVMEVSSSERDRVHLLTMGATT